MNIMGMTVGGALAAVAAVSLLGERSESRPEAEQPKYDGRAYAGGKYALSQSQGDFYRACRMAVDRHNRFMLNRTNEDGCGCVASKVKASSKAQFETMKELYDVRMAAHSAAGGKPVHSKQYLKWSRAEGISDAKLWKALSVLQVAERACTEELKGKDLAYKKSDVVRIGTMNPTKVTR